MRTVQRIYEGKFKKNEKKCPHNLRITSYFYVTRLQDGDYSRSIPEQHHERLNVRKLNIAAPKANNLCHANGLCRTCNANQELKIRQIASYVPFREANYDQEIELFK